MPRYWTSYIAPLCLAFLMTPAVMWPDQSASAQSKPKHPPKVPVVTALKLRPIKTSTKKYTCPAAFTLSAEILTNGATKVKYTFVSSDGRSWPQHTLTFASASQQSVSQSFKVGSAGKNVNDSIQLSILSPNSLLSNTIVLALACGK